VYRIRKKTAFAVFFAAASCAAVPAYAQSLALTYKLDARPESAEQAPAAVNRCAGFNWMTSIGACGRELFTRISPPRSADGTYSRGDGYEPVEVATVPDLPSLGQPAPTPRIRSAGGREALIGSTRTADFLLRLGSKYRVKGNDDGGLDAYKFTDANYETHRHNNAHKAVGVELLVPFQ